MGICSRLPRAPRTPGASKVSQRWSEALVGLVEFVDALGPLVGANRDCAHTNHGCQQRISSLKGAG